MAVITGNFLNNYNFKQKLFIAPRQKNINKILIMGKCVFRHKEKKIGIRKICTQYSSYAKMFYKVRNETP